MFFQQGNHQFIPDDAKVISENVLTVGGLLATLTPNPGDTGVYLVGMTITMVHNAERYFWFSQGGFTKLQVIMSHKLPLYFYWSPSGLRLSTGAAAVAFNTSIRANNFISYLIYWRSGTEA